MKGSYKFARKVSGLFFYKFCHLKVYGRENLPATPYIIAPNHISNNDPPLIGVSVIDRDVCFLAKEELFLPNKIFAYIISKLNAIRLRRGGIDVDAIRIAIKMIHNGHPLVIFPEGTRNFSDELLLQGKPGVAFIMMKANVPIVPTFLIGTNKSIINLILKKNELSVTFGKPIYPDVWKGMKTKEARIYLVNIIMDEIRKLYEEKNNNR